MGACGSCGKSLGAIKLNRLPKSSNQILNAGRIVDPSRPAPHSPPRPLELKDDGEHLVQSLRRRVSKLFTLASSVRRQPDVISAARSPISPAVPNVPKSRSV